MYTYALNSTKRLFLLKAEIKTGNSKFSDSIFQTLISDIPNSDLKIKFKDNSNMKLNYLKQKSTKSSKEKPNYLFGRKFTKNFLVKHSQHFKKE